MASTSSGGGGGGGFFETLCNGSGGRLALGTTILVYLVAYNESSATNVVLATFLASIYGALAARCKTSLRSLQMPYVRASNKFDYTCLFMATWLDALALLCACSILAHTLGICLDAMTGGLARILILGRDSLANEEPFPDVFGVAVVFLLTAMFMLGLEHTRAFSFIMSLGMLGLNAVLSAVGWWNGDAIEWANDIFRPNGLLSFLKAAALLCYSFPCDYPTQRSGMQRFLGVIFNLIACISLLLTSGCLSTIVHYKKITDYVAVPLFVILDENNFHKLVPAAACLLMLTTSGAFLELFPQFYGLIVRFASPEWKVFSKQISYESSDSGNPVLAVFIAGSLCAMLAFACPMQNLIYTLAGGHLTAGCLRAFYLLYTPFRPKFMQQNPESSLSYSRLTPASLEKPSSSSSTSSRIKRSLWNTVNRPHRTKPTRKNKKVEKEWLLLGEPTSPCQERPPTQERDVESVLSEGDLHPSDFDYPESDSDISTDIDAIVDEYRQKIKVTTAGPMDRAVRLPTITSWQVTIFAIIVIMLGIALTLAGIAMHWPPAIFGGVIGVLIIGLMMSLIPSYSSGIINVSPVLCCSTIMLSALLFSACMVYSWPAIVFWITAGLLVLIRCDTWCCNFNDSQSLNEQLIPSINASKATTATIRMPRPPKGIVTIPTRVNGR